MARNDISGTALNSFTVLNSIPNPDLHAVMVDLDLVTENPEEQLDAFKSEEMARAKITKENYRNFLEKQKQKTAPQTEEEELEYTLGVISNQNRDLDSILTMGGEDIVEEGAIVEALPCHISS
jgi:hypothetical protein